MTSPGTGNEPIVTHDRFLSELGGKPSAPLNGAIFRDPVTGEISTDDATAEFDRFALMIGGLRNPLAGVDSYICANNTVWTKSWTSRTKPTVHPIRISNPEGPAPDYGGSSNWLELPTAYTLRGNVYSCVARWLASGRGGWNNIVYAT